MSCPPNHRHRRTGLALALIVAVLAATAVDAQDTAPAPPAEAPVATPPPATNEADALKAAIDTATAVLDAMDAGDFAAVHARFDPTMAAAVSEAQLREIWTMLPKQIGAARGRGEPKAIARDGSIFVRYPLMYEVANAEAMLAFEADGKISGFRLRPAEATVVPGPPVPADANYTETEVRVGDAATALPATLALPKGDGPFPAVVLVHGSGPHDRDETIGPNKPFLDIARGLAERGIAVLRYDKRNKARPQDYAQGVTIDNETTDDAVRALATLRAQPGIDPKRVFVLGHSQGAMMAPRIAARDRDTAGIVLLAAPSRPLLDLLLEQNRRLAVLNDGKTDDKEAAQLAQLAAIIARVRRGEAVTPAEAPLGLPTAYWQTADAVDPVAEAIAIPQPLLVLQGARDMQVVDADWQRWKQAFHADPRATFKLYETLNHLAIPGEGTLQDYGTPGHVSADLIADIAAWIGAQRLAGPAATE